MMIKRAMRVLLLVFGICNVVSGEVRASEYLPMITEHIKETFEPLFEGYKSGRFPNSEILLAQHQYLSEVVKTKSELQYKPIKSLPQEERKGVFFRDYGSVRLQMYALRFSGEVIIDHFSSNETVTGDAHGLIKGLNEGLNLMRPGEIFSFFIPSKIAYGEKGLKGKVNPGEAVIFIVHLVEVNPVIPFSETIRTTLEQPLLNAFPLLKMYHLAIFLMIGTMRFGSRRLTRYLRNRSRKPKALARHILFDKKQKSTAEEVKQTLRTRLATAKSAEDKEKFLKLFSEKAKEFSKCPSKSKGGNLGWFNQGQMVPEFDKLVFNPSTEENKVHGPLETQFGFHLIYLEKRQNVPNLKKNN